MKPKNKTSKWQLLKQSIMETFLMARCGGGNPFRNMDAAVNRTLNKFQEEELNSQEEEDTNKK